MAKKRGRKAKKNKSKVSITVGLMIVISILLAVLIYAQSGYIGRILSPALGGLMGFVKYIIPVGIFLIGIELARGKKTHLHKKIIQYAVFLIAICTVFTTFQIAGGKLSMEGDFSAILDEAYNLRSTK